MRHIPLGDITATLFADVEGQRVERRLLRAQSACTGMNYGEQQEYIARRGRTKWSPVKERLTDRLGHKCWYTEAELVGADLTIDHYRPKKLYPWLAFEITNYRVACPFANSPKRNEEHGCMGGKGDDFPLLPPARRARSNAGLRHERPVILDPCSEGDCSLLAFQTDGRPVLSPAAGGDATAAYRVEESKVLLNLDHPDFNTKREQLYHEIDREVRTYEEQRRGSRLRHEIWSELKGRLAPDAPFSAAARCYLQIYRHLDWVEELLSGA